MRSLNPGSTPIAITGDAARGKAVYRERGYGACHVLEGVGRAYGPDLSSVGAQRGPAYIEEARSSRS